MYLNNENGNNNSFIPAYQLLVYKTADQVNPIDSEGKIKNSDSNKNTINDWIEIKRQGGSGKAYAIYQVLPKELLKAPVDMGAADVIYRVALTDIYDVVRNLQGDLVKDDLTKDFKIEQIGQTIDAGSYDFYLISTNTAEQQSLVSVKQSVVLPRVAVIEPPQVDTNIIGQGSDGQDLIDFNESLLNGEIPLNWTYVAEATNKNPLLDLYTKETSDTFIESHMIVVYREEGGLDPIEDATSKISICRCQ